MSTYKYAARNSRREPIEEEKNILNHLIGHAEHEELPIEILDAYWRAKEMSQRAGVRMFSTEMLTSVVLHSGYDHDPPANATVMDLFRSGDLKRNDWIEVLWRNEWIRAQIHGISQRDKTIRAFPEGEAQAKNFAVEHTRLVENAPVNAGS